MDMDLLFTAKGEPGLIGNENLIKKAAGIVLNSEERMMSVEFIDSDYMDFNIPVEQEFVDALSQSSLIHLGSFKNDHIAQAYQVPFMFADDPYRNMGEKQPEVKAPLLAFEFFLKAAVAGQPVHRDDLGDDSSSGCVLGDAVPSALTFAPHLARQRAMEAAPKAMPTLGMNAPGMGLGGGGGGGIIRGNGFFGGGSDED